MAKLLQVRLSLVAFLMMVGFGVMGQAIPQITPKEDTKGGNPDGCVYHCNSTEIQGVPIGMFIFGITSSLPNLSNITLELKIKNMLNQVVEEYSSTISVEDLASTIINDPLNPHTPTSYYYYHNPFGVFYGNGIHLFEYTLHTTVNGRQSSQTLSFTCNILAGEGFGGKGKRIQNTSINHTSNTQVNIYPNPTTDIVNISYTLKANEQISVSIYNQLGQKVEDLLPIEQNSGQNNQAIDISHFESGIYFIKLKVNQKIETIKVVKL